MPASSPLPTIRELLEVYAGGVLSARRNADTIRGSLIDIFGGVAAVLLRRIAARDQEEARRLYFDTAPAGALDEIVEQRISSTLVRREKTFGTGTANISRASVADGAGTVRKGTRIRVTVGSSVRVLEVSADKVVGSTVAATTVDVVATVPGDESAVAAAHPDVRFEDELWTDWQVDSVSVARGTLEESPDAFRARAKQEESDARPGYEAAIIREMRNAGASYVALFADEAVGLNRVVVGDSGFSTPTDLLLRCRIAIASVGVAGSSLQVLPMVGVGLQVSVAIRFWEDPSHFDLGDAQARAIAAVYEYFRTRENPHLWSESVIRGRVVRAVAGIQSITVTTSLPEPSLATMFNVSPLPRYIVNHDDIQVTFAGPL